MLFVLDSGLCLDSAWNLRGCVGHKPRSRPPVSAALLHIYACGSSGRLRQEICLFTVWTDAIATHLCWASSGSPLLSPWSSFWASRTLRNLPKSKDSTSGIGRKIVLSSGGPLSLRDPNHKGNTAHRCAASQKTAAEAHVLIRMPGGWQHSHSNFSFIDHHSTFLRNQQGDAGSDC